MNNEQTTKLERDFEFAFDNVPTGELISGIPGYMDMLYEKYDKAIGFLESAVIKQFYPSGVWLEYPTLPLDKPMHPADDAIDVINKYNSESGTSLVFPIMISSGSRDVELGSLVIGFDENENETDADSMNIGIIPNRKLPRSYRKYANVSTDRISDTDTDIDDDMYDILFDCVSDTFLFTDMCMDVNTDRFCYDTICKLGLPFVHDLERADDKMCAVVPYLKNIVKVSDMQKSIEDRMNAWVKEHVSRSAVCEVRLSWINCIMTIAEGDDIGGMFVYDFHNKKGDLMWPGRDVEMTSFAVRLRTIKEKINRFFIEEAMNGVADMCYEMFFYNNDLECVMEDACIGDEITSGEGTVFRIDFSKTSFPENLWNGRMKLDCGIEANADAIREILPGLEAYIAGHPEIGRMVPVEYVGYDE